MTLIGNMAQGGVEFDVQDLRCEDLVDPLGIDQEAPRLSWRMRSDARGAAQTAYRILCATEPGLLEEGKADLWDSGKVASDASRFITYAGKALARSRPFHWTVQIWNEQGVASGWSEPAFWTSFDMPTDADWQGRWIRGGVMENRKVAPWLRRTFDLSARPQRAYLYMNVIGYARVFINGRSVGEGEFAPHVTQLDRRTHCITYDVTDHLVPGDNAIGVWLGYGWAGSSFARGAAGTDHPTFRAQLEIIGEDGAHATVVTDDQWRTKPSHVERTGNWKWNRFGGERIDASGAVSNWHAVDFDDAGWAQAEVLEGVNPGAVVSAEMLQPNRVIETLKPASVQKLASGDWLVDLGKAMTGTYEIRFPPGPRGHKVSLEFGDAWEDGKLNHFNQTSEYIFSGEGPEVFRNQFNYVSGRYLLVRGLDDGELTGEDVRGYLITTDLPKASTFRCSSETLNGIYAMMEHTLRCLMLGGYQVDCHSRERLGYGGDGQASLDTTLYLLRSDAFYRKWTRDWMDAQDPGTGGLPYAAPSYPCGGGPFWCGFLVATTLKHYQHYGDIALVERNYAVIRKWFELVESKTVDAQQQKFCGGWYLGDWATPEGVAGRNNEESVELFVNCYMIHVLEQGAQLADLLGKSGDAEAWRASAESRSKATHKRFFRPDTRSYGQGDQADYIMPLYCGVVPPELTGEVFSEFEKHFRETRKGHLGTGLSGTYMMIRYLTEIGRSDLVYTFASKTTYPSWGHMIQNGATATWEHWDGKASRIHNCFNSIGSWFIEGLGGIQPDPETPGFKHAIIRPAFLEKLDFVEAGHDTVYGTFHSNWQRDDKGLRLDVVVPANTSATLMVPVDSPDRMTEGGRPLADAAGISDVREQDGSTMMNLVSGRYTFAW